MRITLVEDDRRIAHFVAKGLREQAYAVDVTVDSDDACYKRALSMKPKRRKRPKRRPMNRRSTKAIGRTAFVG
jgi:hypothetical protein